MAKEQVFRRQLRIPIPDDDTSLDAKLISFLEKLETESAFRSQEWVRYALRRAFVEQEIALNGAGEQINKAIRQLNAGGRA